MVDTKIPNRPPATIGEYEIIRKIGEGGLAEVFLARQRSLNRKVAIKMLHPRLSEESELIRRFEREATTLAAMSHPNIVQIFDRGEDNDRLYFVMQYVDGTDFSLVLQEENWDLPRKLGIVIQILKGLDYAHKNGIVHRDIKPANILVDSEDNALIADFGISYLLGGNATQLTQPGAIIGTFAYMSPEQKEDSSQADHRSDLYAVGVILYQVLTGKPPLARRQLPSQVNPQLPAGFDAVVTRALQPNPSARYQKAVEMKDELLTVMHRSDSGQVAYPTAVVRTKTTQGNYAFLDTLRNSVTSSTYLVEDRETGSLFVIKKQNKPDVGLQEARLLTNMRHPNILPIHGAGCDSAKLVIFMEYAQGGSLADQLVKPMHWHDARRIMLQIASGMDFAHRNNVIHGNLKPSNILFDGEGVAKVSDFALAPSVDRNSPNCYGAPERRKSKAGDIYSAGIIFYQLLTNRRPTFDTYGKFVWIDGARTTPAALKTVIEKMLKTMPVERLQNFSEIHDLIVRSESPAPTAREQHDGVRSQPKLRLIILWGTFAALLIVLLLLLSK